ncbi:glycosyltransferase family 9 protein [Actinokineospora sp. NPDC004072]
MEPSVLVVRLDSDGDVLTAGPAVRAAAAGGRVTLLCGPAGERAARMLPGVSAVRVWNCPWIAASPPAVAESDVAGLVGWLVAGRFDVALLLTSYHQSPLPMALLARMAGVRFIAAVCEDYPGSLLDVRLRPGSDVDEMVPEPERALAVAEAAGFALPPGDDGGLRVRGVEAADDLPRPYVVVHPGATAPARAWSPHRCAEAVAALAERGHRVVVTGGPGERALTARVAGAHGIDLGGRTSFPRLAGVLAGAEAVVVGNTGPAHLAAAVGTPVVSLFSPVVPAAKWAPYRAEAVVLGDQRAACAGTRAKECPIPGHPCLDGVSVAEVVAAVEELVGVRA